MKFQIFADTWKGMRTTSVFLLASNVTLSIALLATLIELKRQDVIVALVPPSLTKEARIGASSADAEYLMSFGMYIATLTGNVTPKNVVFTADAISSLVDAQLYPVIRQQLYALAESPVFRDRGGSIFFEPVGVSVDLPTGKVFVQGNQVSLSAAGRQNRIPFVYEIQIEIRERRPVVVAIDKYEGRVERSLQWEEKNQRAAQRSSKRFQTKDDEAAPWFEDSVLYSSPTRAEFNEENMNEDADMKDSRMQLSGFQAEVRK